MVLTLLSIFLKNSQWLLKVRKMVQQAYCQIVEMIVVDIVFAAYYNLVSDYKQTLTASRVVGKSFSLIAIVMMFGHYLRMLE